jgi:catechol 2,3-dioxygenase-like lactoylglutathione lyase family enzyme
MRSSDARRLASFYTDLIGYVGAWDGEVWRGSLSGKWLRIANGAANSLDHAAFAVADDDQLAALRARLSEHAVAAEQADDPEMAGGALLVRDPDGNRLLLGVARGPVGEANGAPIPASLQHIVFASDEVAPMLRFYRDVLGFATSDYVLSEDRDLTSVFLRCNEEHHNLAVFRASRKRLDHICFDVEDWSGIRDWADSFAAHHIPLQWGPGRHGPGNNLFLFVNDPDENWLEFSAELERIEGGRQTKHWAHEERTLNSWGTALMRT